MRSRRLSRGFVLHCGALHYEFRWQGPSFSSGSQSRGHPTQIEDFSACLLWRVGHPVGHLVGRPSPPEPLHFALFHQAVRVARSTKRSSSCTVPKNQRYMENTLLQLHMVSTLRLRQNYR